MCCMPLAAAGFRGEKHRQFLTFDQWDVHAADLPDLDAILGIKDVSQSFNKYLRHPGNPSRNRQTRPGCSDETSVPRESESRPACILPGCTCSDSIVCSATRPDAAAMPAFVRRISESQPSSVQNRVSLPPTLNALPLWQDESGYPSKAYNWEVDGAMLQEKAGVRSATAFFSSAGCQQARNYSFETA